MTKPDSLRLATSEEIEDALAHALRHRRGKRHDVAAPMVAAIAAARLREHLEAAGLLVMKRPEAPLPSTSPHMPKRR